jgi:hypothetical protein
MVRCGAVFLSSRTERSPISTQRQAYWTPEHGHDHERTVLSQHKDPAHLLMPGVHRVASLLERWMLGPTKAGLALSISTPTSTSSPSAQPTKLATSRTAVLPDFLRQAIMTNPITYRNLIVNPPDRSPAHVSRAPQQWPEITSPRRR